MLCLISEYVNRKCEPVPHWAYLRIEDPLHILRSLVCGVKTSLAIEFHWVMLQKVF